MEEANVARRGSLPRIVGKAGGAGLVTAIAALGMSGEQAASGVMLGALAAAFYAWGYLSTHLQRAGRERFMDGPLAGRAFVRMVAVAFVGAIAYLAGRSMFVGYLVGFAIIFAVIVVSEIPRVTRELRARGMIG